MEKKKFNQIIDKIIAEVFKFIKLAIKSISFYLKKHVTIRRVFAKLFDLAICTLIFIISLVGVCFVAYLAMMNITIVLETLRNFNLFIALIITLAISAIYFMYFSFGRKIFKVEKISNSKGFYSEPIFHFILFLIYMMIVDLFLENVNISEIAIIFIAIYLVSFLYNGGFWNKNAKILRREQ